MPESSNWLEGSELLRGASPNDMVVAGKGFLHWLQEMGEAQAKAGERHHELSKAQVENLLTGKGYDKALGKETIQALMESSIGGLLGPMVIRGFHGTPHRFAPVEHNPFGEFQDRAIGSGEGAQAYGYGHYVAENPNTSKQYAKMGRGVYIGDQQVWDRMGLMDEVANFPEHYEPAIQAFAKAKGDVEKAKSLLFDRSQTHAGIVKTYQKKIEDITELRDNYLQNKRMDEAHSMDGAIAEARRTISKHQADHFNHEEAVKFLQENPSELKFKGGDHLEVSMRPEEHHLLDWDKQMLEHPEEFQQKLHGVAEKLGLKDRFAEARFASEIEPTAAQQQILHEINIEGQRTGWQKSPMDLINRHKQSLKFWIDHPQHLRKDSIPLETLKTRYADLEAFSPENLTLDNSGAWRHMTGEKFYHTLVNQTGDPAVASAALKEAGIPGLKYLDQLSRDLPAVNNITLARDGSNYRISSAPPQGSRQWFDATDGMANFTEEEARRFLGPHADDMFDRLNRKITDKSVEPEKGIINKLAEVFGLGTSKPQTPPIPAGYVEKALDKPFQLGTRNYVIFDPSDIWITGRNGERMFPVDHDPWAAGGEK